MTKWLGVTTEENWQVCIKNGVWGASNDYESLMQEAKEGDELLVYLIKYKLAGIFRVSRGYFFSKKRLWPDGVYPHRLRITPVIRPKEPIDIKDWYHSKFEPETGKAPQGYFQRAIRKFYDDTEHEFEMFRSVLHQETTEDSHSNGKWSFPDLHDYIVYDMDEDMQANYQPVMLKVLLEAGGNATKDLIVEEIKKFNLQEPRGGFRNIPVFQTLEAKQIVLRKGDTYVLNVEDFDQNQRSELITLSKWKIYDQPIPLEELAQAFDKNRKLFMLDRPPLQEILKARDEFVRDYSQEKVLQLNLDDYVQGKTDSATGEANHTTFCFRLERRVPWFGNIWGTPADKFGIYYSKEKKKYIYKDKDYRSPEEAFEAIKKEIYSIIEAAKAFSQDRDWAKLASTLEGRYNIERHVRSRILAIYFPEEFPQIHASDAVEKILAAIGVPESRIEGGLFLNHQKLMEIKHSHPIMKNWSTIDFSHFVWMVVMERVTRKDLKEKALMATTNYLILRTQPDSEWLDKEGSEYHFGTNVPHHSRVAPGSLVVFDRNISGEIQYLGHAEVENVVEENRNRSTAGGRSIIDKVAKLKGYVKFDSPIVRTDTIAQMLEKIPGYNNQHSIRPITRELYDAIANHGSSAGGVGWEFNIEDTINEILGVDTARELAIPRDLVKRIILHLKAGKNVILIGPPGVGKTDLAQRILRIVGKRVIGKDSPLEAVASDEWTRYEVIGGIDINGHFQQGWVTNAAQENRWLLIDEFNRANMNKAFGEMFLAIEYKKITIRPAEKTSHHSQEILIPQDFRMLCTMNDFDKNLLLTELSYGLISRFAFVPITPDVKEEPRVVENRIKSELPNSASIYDSCKEQMGKYFEFINRVRERRNIGIRTSIDVLRYLVAATSSRSTEDEKWTSLNNALCDYVLPQFDRLDKDMIDHVHAASISLLTTSHFTPFSNELKQASDKLQRAAGWLVKEDVS
jgi:MoxR-like ATPase/predicted RNA-binding protein